MSTKTSELRSKCCGDCEFFFHWDWMNKYLCAILSQERRAGDLTCDSFLPTKEKALLLRMKGVQ
jgi:hypothetical protein